MSKGFKIICLECDSDDVIVYTFDNGEYVELEGVCQNCGQVKNV